MIKLPAREAQGARLILMLDSSGNFTGTQTPGTNVHMARGTVDDRLNALDVGLPCTVRPSVRVRDLDAEGNVLIAKCALCHLLHLLAVQNQVAY